MTTRKKPIQKDDELSPQPQFSKKDLISQEYFEDYAIGYHLDQVLKYKIFNIQTNKYFIDFQEKDYNTI